MTSALEHARTCPIDEIVPMSPEMLKCPSIMNQRFHHEAPVFQDPTTGIFFISRYDDVVAMSMDHRTFSSVMPGGQAGTGSMTSEDPEIKALASDPEIISLVQSGDTLALLAHPRLKKVVERLSRDL